MKLCALVRLLCGAAFLSLFLVVSANAATLNVPSSLYPTVQAGVDASSDGDVVLVADGTYIGPGNRDIDFKGKNITVTSQNGPTKTIIDCGGTASTDGSGNHRGFKVGSGGTNKNIRGFTVINGYEFKPATATGGDFSGGGIDVSGGNATVQNCIVTNCTASGGGGGISCQVSSTGGGTITLSNCTIFGNTDPNGSSNGGGGVLCFAFAGKIMLTDCNIYGNSAQSEGGGILDIGGILNTSLQAGSISLESCAITDNTVPGGPGGGVSNYADNGSAITLTDCKVTGNTAAFGGGGVYNFVDTDGGLITLASCTISANAAPSNRGGGVASDIYGGLITLSNCSLTRNTAHSGGGVANYSGEDNNGGAITINNCSLDGNAAANGGSGVSNDISNNGGTFTLTNDIVYGDASSEVSNSDGAVPAISYCDIQGGSLGTGNIDKDPLFVNSATNDLHLNPGSPCLGKGTHTGAPALDKDGRTRPAVPSIGAYELATTIAVSPQYPTIQSAVTVALSGDTVLVPSGTYSGPGNVDYDFSGKDVTVKSMNGPTATIIDCGGYPSSDGSGNHRAFYVHSGETSAVIDGFTIRNGYTTPIPGVPNSGYGGGVCIDGGDASILHCIFTGNTATAGGGIALLGTKHYSITITNAIFTQNTAKTGGGVYNADSGGTVTLTSGKISGNTASSGGGIYTVSSGGSDNYIGCAISGNSATTGGGGFYDETDTGDSTVTITNCSVSGNASPLGNDMENEDYVGSTITLLNDIFYSSATNEIFTQSGPAPVASYSDIKGSYGGTGNIDKDPLFVNATTGDLHLKPGSPCRGAGTSTGAPATDLDGNPRPNPPSMGAYEFVPSSAHTFGIIGISMISSHELDVDIATASTIPLQRLITLDMTINGQQVHVSDEVNFSSPLDSPHSFVIDLKKAGVPRFRNNQRFTITETYQDTGNVADKKDGVILLPVVLVPGIGPLSGTIIGQLMNDDHPGGGPGTFPGFEKYLTAQSLNLVKGVFGNGYSTMGPYQTLYTLTYVRNVESFSDGSNKLANQINTIIANSSLETYADRVNIVTHSKGGLVTRQYLADIGKKSGSQSPSDVVKQVILTVPPNLGSPLAVAGRITSTSYDYRNLSPTYNWFRTTQIGKYFRILPISDLDNLNQQRLPEGIQYSIMYSRTFHYYLGVKTPTTYTALALFGQHFGFDDGDGVVPWFSHLGLQFDPNHPNAPLTLIPAFVDKNGQPVITDEVEFNCFHSSFLDNSDVQKAIFARLTGDIN
ncbi:MAG: choice-of-anchor Q domain-containing protein [Janthinobacterium lividum]